MGANAKPKKFGYGLQRYACHGVVEVDTLIIESPELCHLLLDTVL